MFDAQHLIDLLIMGWLSNIPLAIGSILLIKGLLEQYGISLEPLHLSVWAIPTAIAAFLIHGFRLWRLDRRLKRSAPEDPA